MSDSTMQYIDIKEINPHRDNPRKDLGDLSELIDSIKSKGILQNLTVVPRLGELSGKHIGYTVVIGHRRLAAAKLAGLESVPCVIADMNGIDQIATMLLENMQRNDLTLTEQANGFQMMIDLGDSVTSIAQKTGLSENTIRRRVKLNELDPGKLTKAMERGATLMDFAELEKIKDAKLKNKVLESIGTNNFKWELSSAMDKESEPERKAELIEALSKYAVQVEKKGNLEYVAMFHGFKMNNWFKAPTDTDTVNYFFVVESTSIGLYRESSPNAVQEEKPDPKAADYDKRKMALEALSTQAYQMRYEFVYKFTGAKKHVKEINDFAMYQLAGFGYYQSTETIRFLELEEPKVEDYQKKQDAMRRLILGKYSEAPEYTMLAVAYCALESKNHRYYRTSGLEYKIQYEKEERLDLIYDGLISLGYIMSDDELALRDGSHELFKAKEVEK